MSQYLSFCVISDTHKSHREITIPDTDFLIHCGDMSSHGKKDTFADFFDWFEQQTPTHKICIAGNHDTLFEEEPEVAKSLVPSNVIYLQDDEVILEGIKFYGSPWQPEFCSWAFNLPRGEPLKKKWQLIPEDTEILITHGPPKGILDFALNDGSPQGCGELRKRVFEVGPRYHLFGHIHEDFGKETVEGITFLNCSYNDLPKGKRNGIQVFECLVEG